MKLQFILGIIALFTMQLSALDYSSPTRPDNSYSVPMRADMEFFPGRLVAVDADGLAAEAADAEGLTVLGRIRAGAESHGLADRETVVSFDIGVFAYDNSSNAPVTDLHYGKPIYVEDDITVTSDPGDHSIYAGICRGFEGSGKVWVDVRMACVLQAAI
jgi:hypothetical protein